jgi:type II restriction/modification system DNA methylase subunit YeeA
VAERSPPNDPQPVKILQLKVLDPAMGSGHFLVEACRFLGDKLYEAVRLCDDKALTAERRAEKGTKAEREKALAEAGEWRQRILDIPDPDGELVKYLPSRSPEGEESGFSQRRAEALCRRLVATHCLYGVDKNPLAVELAKLALWLESHAEGMPLTFLDHRLVVGDSLTGPFWERLIFRPGNPKEPIENLFSQGLNLKLIFDTKNSYPCYLQ